MALMLKQNKLYTSDGIYLKTLSCPKHIAQSDLEMSERNYRHYHCAGCDKAVINTDLLNEQEIEVVLTRTPDACVYINPLNPTFNIILTDEYDESYQNKAMPL